LLVLLLGVQLLAFRATGLFGKHFWLDETHTYLTVADPDLHHALAGLRGAVNGASPTYFMLLRAFCRLAGGPGEISFHAFSFLFSLLALFGLYLLLRKAFTPLVAFTAVLATWAHPEFFRQAFDARYYAAWTAATVWFAYFLANTREEKRSVLNAFLLAASAMLMCTLHYFGLFTFALVLAFAFLLDGESRLARPRAWIPAAFGPLALAASLPYYFSQHSALAHPDHIPAPSIGQLIRVAGELLPPMQIPVIAVVCLFGILLNQRMRRDPADAETACDLRPLAGITGTLFMLVVLLAFSFVIQPVMVTRYAMPMLAGLAVVMALLMSKTPRAAVAFLLAFFFVTGGVGLHEYAAAARAKDRNTDEFIATLRALPGKAPVAFEISRDFMVVCHYAPDIQDRCRFLDFEEGDIGGVDKFRLSVRDEALIVQKHYGVPSVTAWARLRELPEFYLVAGHRPDQDTAAAERDYPGFTARAVTPRLLLMTAKSPGRGLSP